MSSSNKYSKRNRGRKGLIHQILWQFRKQNGENEFLKLYTFIKHDNKMGNDLLVSPIKTLKIEDQGQSQNSLALYLQSKRIQIIQTKNPFPRNPQILQSSTKPRAFTSQRLKIEYFSPNMKNSKKHKNFPHNQLRYKLQKKDSCSKRSTDVSINDLKEKLLLQNKMMEAIVRNGEVKIKQMKKMIRDQQKMQEFEIFLMNCNIEKLKKKVSLPDETQRRRPFLYCPSLSEECELEIQSD